MTTYKRGARAGQTRDVCQYVCPSEWEPPYDLIDEIEAVCPDVDHVAELEKLKQHDHLRPYRQWSSVYRKWMKRAQRRVDWKREGDDPRQPTAV